MTKTTGYELRIGDTFKRTGYSDTFTAVTDYDGSPTILVKSAHGLGNMLASEAVELVA